MRGHLTLDEREIIAHMHRSGAMQVEIAKRLRRNKGTISRELRRNRSRNGYWGAAAQKKAEKRRSGRPWTPKLERPDVRRYVRERLRRYWSPDQIAGRSRKDFPRQRRKQVSHQTIYTWIRNQGEGGVSWRRYLRRMGRKRLGPENRGRIPASTSIDGRPGVVDRRGRYGDWEGDTVVGAAHRGGAVTLVERKSGYLLLAGVENLQASTVRAAATDLYATMPPSMRKTLTLDNGKEFSEHQRLAAEAALRIYFAKPYCAWQRGTNENTNGLVRQFFPKGTDLANLPEQRFTKVQHLLNHRPRKRLGYQTPCEILGLRTKVAFET